MKNRLLLYFFGIDLLAELVAIYFQLDTIRIISKPLLMIFLLIWVLSQNGIPQALKTLLSGALVFSWMGDVFLLFDKQVNLFFIFGLLSFLIAHLLYIILFIRLRNRYAPRRKWNFFITGALLLYVAAFFYVLYPGLGDLKIPVIVYALVLATMFIAANYAFGLSEPAGRAVITGAALFVLSDSLLALNKFHQPFSWAALAVMLSYALAQLLITMGATKFIRSAGKQ